MNGLDSPQIKPHPLNNNLCLLAPENQPFEPQAEDILTDEDLLDLFRIVKQVLRKNPDPEKLAKLLFCMSYALGDHIKFSKPCHEDRIVFRDNSSGVHSVRLPSTSSCCNTGGITSYNGHNQGHRASSTSFTHSHSDLLRTSEKDSVQKWIDSSSVTSHTSPSPISPLTRLPSVSYLTNQNHSNANGNSTTSLSEISNENNTSVDSYSVRPYTNFRPLYTANTNTNTNANSISSPTQNSNTLGNSNNTAIISSPLINNGNSNSIPSPASSSNTHHVQQQQQQQIVDVAVLANIETPDRTTQNTATTTSSASAPVDRFNSNSNSNTTINSIQQITNPTTSNTEVVMEPQQRGFYYQDGRIAREPVLLQRYAEQGILTQASLMRKRKRHSADANSPYEISNLPVPTKKPKIPHRHGEFEQRRKYNWREEKEI